MKTSVPSRPSRADEILAGAVELFNRKGFHQTTIDDVGAAVGLTGPALYRYYPSKAALLVAVFDSAIEVLLERVGGLKDVQAPDHQKLADLIDYHVDYVLSHRSLMRIIRQEVHSLPEPARQRFRESQQAYLRSWAGIVVGVRSEVDYTSAITLAAGAVALANRFARRQNEIEGPRLKALVCAMVEAALMVPLPGSSDGTR